MNVKDYLLQALGAHLLGSRVAWTASVSEAEWSALFRAAAEQNILPLIYDAVYCCPSFQTVSPKMRSILKQQVHQLVWLQSVKTQEFLSLYKDLSDHSIRPLVVKGIVCRELYPRPDFRLSSDEDLYLPEEKQYICCHSLLLQTGMAPLKADSKPQEQAEISYINPNGQLYIELHKELFDKSSMAYGEMNSLFAGAYDRSIQLSLQGVKLRTMCHTDHLLYLICHGLKHFIHSGFGIRQVCDIVLYANMYGEQIDWSEILTKCRCIHCERFAAALFQIGRRYLGFDWEKAGFPQQWQSIPVDCEAMLEDLLSGGIYGGADMSRKHSSTITLNAVAAEKQGKAGKVNLWKTLLPPKAAIAGQYPYLKRHGWLLPVAWASRLKSYWRETKAVKSSRAAESVKIGANRIKLLKYYGVLK